MSICILYMENNADLLSLNYGRKARYTLYKYLFTYSLRIRALHNNM